MSLPSSLLSFGSWPAGGNAGGRRSHPGEAGRQADPPRLSANDHQAGQWHHCHQQLDKNGLGRRREGSERHAGTLYIIISYTIKAHNQPSPTSHEDWGSNQTYSVNQIGFRLHSLHGLSLTRPKPKFRRHLWGGGVCLPSEECNASCGH